MKIAFAAALLGSFMALQTHAQQAAASTAEVPAPAEASGNYSAAGLYNLANSYARAGKPGLAVLNYERAALLAPNDADIAANLNAVRASAHVASPVHGKLENLAHAESPETVAVIGVLGVLIAGLSILCGTRFPHRRLLPLAGTLAGLAAIAFAVCNTVYWRPRLHDAVVIAATPMRATPVPMGDSLQQLSEAETLSITSAHEDFVLVRTPSGREGWVARADLADVVPGAAPR